jgi:hypothetical protein
VIALYLLAYLWAFWAAYVLAMGLYRAHLSKRLKGLNALLAAPVLLIAYLMDIACNLTIATILFADMPDEWLVTSRLMRYRATDDGWRARWATAICEGLLDVFDPQGDHC